MRHFQLSVSLRAKVALPANPAVLTLITLFSAEVQFKSGKAAP